MRREGVSQQIQPDFDILALLETKSLEAVDEDDRKRIRQRFCTGEDVRALPVDAVRPGMEVGRKQPGELPLASFARSFGPTSRINARRCARSSASTARWNADEVMLQARPRSGQDRVGLEPDLPAGVRKHVVPEQEILGAVVIPTGLSVLADVQELVHSARVERDLVLLPDLLDSGAGGVHRDRGMVF